MSTDPFDLKYNPRLLVSNAGELMQQWTAASQATRERADCALDVPYGADPSETLDVFRAEGQSRALLVFIHGGYWRMMDKRDFSFIAPVFNRAGVTVVIPNYALCPAVTVDVIVRQMLQACAWTYRNGVNFGAPRGPIYVSGHSAGGHLTAMMLAALWNVLSPDLPERLVAAGLSISGLYDLSDIQRTPSINSDVRLTDDVVRRASPANYPPAEGVRLYTAVGAHENEGFHIQNRLIAGRWASVHEVDVSCPGANHFTVLDRFVDPGSKLHRTTLEMMGLG